MKNLCVSKDTINRVKKQPTKKKIFADHISDKALSRVDKELQLINNNKNLIKNEQRT